MNSNMLKLIATILFFGATKLYHDLTNKSNRADLLDSVETEDKLGIRRRLQRYGRGRGGGRGGGRGDSSDDNDSGRRSRWGQWGRRFRYTDKRKLTVALDTTHGWADYYCHHYSSCDVAIQVAICKLKGLPHGELCGLEASVKDHPDLNPEIEQRGGVVKLFPGVYPLQRNIVQYSNIILEGEGIDHTILKLVDNAPSFYVSDWEQCKGGKSGLIRAVKPSKNMVLRGMTLDGNRHNQNLSHPCPDGKHDAYTYGKFGYFVEAVTDVLVEYVKIKSFFGYGFDPHGIGGTFQFTERLTIQHCVAEDNGWDGFTLDKLKNSIFTHNLAQNNGRHGINIVTGTRRLTVSHNQVIGNGKFYVPEFEKDLGCGIEITKEDYGDGCGIKVQNNQAFRTSEITITNNFVEASDKEGICLNNVHSVIVSNNQIFSSDKCISMTDQYRNGQGVRETVITSNICDNSGGVKIAGLSQDNIFRDNNIRVKYKSQAIAFQIAHNIAGANQLNLDQNYYINVKPENREVIFTDDASPNQCTRVIGMVTDRQLDIKPTSNGVVKQFDFEDDELENQDFSLLLDNNLTFTTLKAEYGEDTANIPQDKLPFGNSTIMLIVEITDLDYVPTRIVLQNSNNKRYGLDFQIQPPITGIDEDKVLAWKLGLNIIKHNIVASDYYLKSGEEFNTQTVSELNSLKLYRSNEDTNDESQYINVELIQFGKTNGFA